MTEKINREEIVWDLIEQLNIYCRVSRSYNTTARYYGTEDKLYLSEVHTIYYIGKHEGMSLNELAEITQRTKGATSIMVDSLIKKGLIIKEKDPDDSRRLKIKLTEDGKKVYHFHDELDKMNYGRVSDGAQDISDEEFETSYKVVKRVIKELWQL